MRSINVREERNIILKCAYKNVKIQHGKFESCKELKVVAKLISLLLFIKNV